MARSALRPKPASAPAEAPPPGAETATGAGGAPKRVARRTKPAGAGSAAAKTAKPKTKSLTPKSVKTGSAKAESAKSKSLESAKPKNAGAKFDRSKPVATKPVTRTPPEAEAAQRAGPKSAGPKSVAPKAETAGQERRPEPDRPSAESGAPEPEAPGRSKSADEKPNDPEARAENAENPFLTPEVERFAGNMALLWEESGRAMSAMMRPRDQNPARATRADEIADVVKTLGQVAERWMADPARTADAQAALTSGFVDLWANALKRFSGEPAEPILRADPKDARFKDPEWSEHPVFDFLKQAYLHASRWAEKMVAEAEDLDPHTRHKAGFYVKLLSNAASPSNFVPTNPELLRETIAQKGENLVRGMRMLAEDIAAGDGDLRIRQTDPSGFEVGKNLATTPGKVVYRNDLFELLQYAPTTEMARTRPVLIVPPWINKFYVLDLTDEKSLIRWAVEQGLTVFCISWVNPDARHATRSFDDYMRDGIMRATDIVREICGVDRVDAVGYCVGGTLLSVTLAYMAAKDDRRIASATLLTTQVDFTHGGDLKVFVDEAQIAAVEAKMAEAGYLEGASMANAFNMIRSNDMIFPYIVNNYLKGKAPFPFDLLYWNSDATRMPAANHSFYLRSCYLNNDLAHGRMEICGEKLDLGRITAPVYELATKEDHIAPAKSVFLGAQLFGGPVRFVLAGSGHIAGVVNPPAKIKYQHWVGGEPRGELSHWLDRAEERPGSWWPDWRAWLAAADATMVTARIPGEAGYEALEDAPGGYVKMKS